eukprot:363808-Chlamydomonas_euryale.AAC.2
MGRGEGVKGERCRVCGCLAACGMGSGMCDAGGTQGWRVEVSGSRGGEGHTTLAGRCRRRRRPHQATEKLEGGDSYKCEGCKCGQPHTKRLQVYRYPRVLILTLKRFAQRPVSTMCGRCGRCGRDGLGGAAGNGACKRCVWAVWAVGSVGSVDSKGLRWLLGWQGTAPRLLACPHPADPHAPHLHTLAPRRLPAGCCAASAWARPPRKTRRRWCSATSAVAWTSPRSATRTRCGRRQAAAAACRAAALHAACRPCTSWWRCRITVGHSR